MTAVIDPKPAQSVGIVDVIATSGWPGVPSKFVMEGIKYDEDVRGRIFSELGTFLDHFEDGTSFVIELFCYKENDEFSD